MNPIDYDTVFARLSHDPEAQDLLDRLLGMWIRGKLNANAPAPESKNDAPYSFWLGGHFDPWQHYFAGEAA